MKYYLILTGAVFGLIVIAHIARMFAEGMRVASEPIFTIATILSMAFVIWSIFLFRQLMRSK